MRWTCGVVVAMLICATFVQRVAAQDPGPRIPDQIQRATTTLTTDQIKEIDAFVRYWMGVLTSGNPEDAVKAQDTLTRVFLGGGSTIFLGAYSTSLSRQLTTVVSTQDPAIGLNAMIVASKLMDAGAIDVIKAGLANTKNVPVRYWAAKVVEMLPINLKKRDPNLVLTPAEQRSLLQALVGAAQAEPSDHVMGKILPAIVSLTIPDAQREMIKVFEGRLAVHVKDPAIAISPETEAMEKLFRIVVEQRAQSQGKTPDDKLMSEMARVSFLYLANSTRILASNGRLSAAARAEHARMANISDQFLRWAVEKVVSPQTPKLPAGPAQFPGNWERFSVEVAQWPVLLSSPPFKFDAKQLNVIG